MGRDLADEFGQVNGYKNRYYVERMKEIEVEEKHEESEVHLVLGQTS